MPYSRELTDLILGKMAEGLSLREICKADGMPSPASVRAWVIADTDGLAERYARAREAQAEHWADEILEAADDGSNDWMERKRRDGSIERVLDREHVERSRQRVEARKWLLAKILPKKYGDKVEIAHSGRVDSTVITDDPRRTVETFLTEFTMPAPEKETRH